jgi:eukaryotic-like serine/threonine-protein kinase
MRECTVCQSCFPDTVAVCNRDGAGTITTLPIKALVNKRYVLEKRIGGGSVSVVYLASDQTDGTECALRIILPDLVGHDSTVSAQFLTLARRAFALRHPNIVSVTDSGLIDDRIPFLTTDFVAGLSLRDTLADRRRLSPAEAVDYMTAIGAGLAHAHASGVVHGDLKPRNILIEKNRALSRAIKIADFGVSVLKSGKIEALAKGKTSGILRSPVYLAPEEWSEEGADTPSDIYSLGVILYQMLVGVVPFKGKSIPAIMRAHLVESPPGIAGRFPGLSSDIERVVLRALEKDPANRPATVESFVEEFRQAVLLSAESDVEDTPVDLNRTVLLTVAVDEEEEPREPAPMLSAATQSLLLALGVVFVLALIGVGVYYSRISQ